MEPEINQAVQYVFGGGLSGVLATVAIIWLRSMLRGDRMAGVDATANATAVDRLLRIIDEQQQNEAALRLALTEANTRTDEAYNQRNALVHEVADLKSQVATLAMQVQISTETIAAMRGELQTLRGGHVPNP